MRKPPGFHWDFFLLGITVFIAGLLGFPAPNGLIPQAPLHTASLVITGFEEDDSAESDKTLVSTPVSASDRPSHRRTSSTVPEHAIELESIDERAEEASAGRSQGMTGRRRLSNSAEGLVRRLSRNITEEEKQRRKSVKEQRASRREVPIAVVEQRVSNLAQGCLCRFLVSLFLLVP